MSEIWKDVIGYEGRYMVSNLGRIKSLKRIVKRSHNRLLPVKERILIPSVCTGDYREVKLENKKHRVHRLVAKAFIVNKSNKPFINHKNGITSDNKASNLEWCTQSENMRHAVDVLGARIGIRKDGMPSPLKTAIKMYDNSGKFIKEYTSQTDAAIDLKCDVRNINNVLRGQSHSCTKHKYSFKYKNQ